jgi:hypothetical protein
MLVFDLAPPAVAMECELVFRGNWLAKKRNDLSNRGIDCINYINCDWWSMHGNAPYDIKFRIADTKITDTVLTVRVQRSFRVQPRQAQILDDRIARADGKIRSNDAICPQLHAMFLRLFFQGATILYHILYQYY